MRCYARSLAIAKTKMGGSLPLNGGVEPALGLKFEAFLKRAGSAMRSLVLLVSRKEELYLCYKPKRSKRQQFHWEFCGHFQRHPCTLPSAKLVEEQ